MFVLSNLLMALADVLGVLFMTLEIVILIRVILSWTQANVYTGLGRTIVIISEPLLSPFRKLLPPWKLGGIDFSPICAIFCLYFLRLFLISTLVELADKLR